MTPLTIVFLALGIPAVLLLAWVLLFDRKARQP